MVVLKKKYFDVRLEIFNTIIPLLAFKSEALEGKIIKFDLTKILKGKGSEARFTIHKKNDNLVGEIYHFSLYPSYIKRLIGHNVSIVEDSFIVKTKDVLVRVKPFLITRRKVHRSVRKALRNTAKSFLEKSVANKTRSQLFQEITSSILQYSLNKKLKKVYPLAVCELRIVKVEKPEKTQKSK